MDVDPTPALAPASLTGNKVRPEITWSLMHPVKPDRAYMQKVIEVAARYQVDSFEICGEVHSSGGGLDGAIRFRDYPSAASELDLGRVDETIRLLQDVVSVAHKSGRPVYYWHREVMVPRLVVEKIPGLLDRNKEFDLLGEAYQTLVRSKIREFFDNVSEMDGLVLTLTESDYSVIHNSDPRRYPPQQVVQRLAATFAYELSKRGKRFILRSFGSIAQDYEDILAGAALVAAKLPFEIETKITPYDFSPFLPFNPFLKRTANHDFSAEYDSIGEFLGAGFLPAADPARVIASVAYARAQGVNRHVIRVDRIGHATFESTQAINLLAFDRAIRDPKTTAESVWREWAGMHWPDCAGEMAAIMQRGIEMVKKTHFIDGHVIFHAFPIHAELKWIQASGILSVFSPGRSLAHHQGMWGILTNRTTPTREMLLREKDEAVTLADDGLRAIDKLRGRLAMEEYLQAVGAWQCATVVTRAVRAWCRCVSAYFDDMEHGRRTHPTLSQAVAAAKTELGKLLQDSSNTVKGVFPSSSPSHEYGEAETVDDHIDAAYTRPILQHLAWFVSVFEAEFQEHQRWKTRLGVIDYIICGGIVDDIRVERYMHAGHASLVEGRPARFAGNRVFPNGFLTVRLGMPAEGEARLVIQGHAGSARGFSLTINGQTRLALFSDAGEYDCVIDGGPVGEAIKTIEVRIQKQGSEYPSIFGLGTVALSEGIKTVL